MMTQAFKEIDQSDLLIAETSEKGMGVGIEIGYAKALGKVVIYIRNKSAEHSTTASGASDFRIIYEEPKSLATQLASILKPMIFNINR